MKKALLAFPILLGILAMVYLLGPVPDYPEIDPIISELDIPLNKLQDSIASLESRVANLKPDNEAKIVWADTARKTEWAIVYLPGFSASEHEGYPVHRQVAEHFGMNLYLARIDGHGIDDPEAFVNLSPSSLINSAKFAIAVGQLIGENVIVMSCSTGGTYSIYLAAHNPDLIDAQVLYSPNIEIFDPNVKLLGGPWGLQLGRAIIGDYQVIKQSIGTPKEQYWTTVYRMEGLVALQHLLEDTMTEEVFQKVTQPTFMGYYYKNEDEQDKVVSVAAMKRFAQQVGTAEADFRQMPFPETGNHVISSDLQSSDYQSVRDESIRFLEEVIGLVGVKDTAQPY